ncbi:MAG: carbohydrate binding domain-containing protein [Deinococcales bacterium]
MLKITSFWYVSHLSHLASEGANPLACLRPKNSGDGFGNHATPTPTPPAEGSLNNPSFENSLTNWNNCGNASNLSIVNDTYDGTKALQVQNGGCVYQEIVISPSQNYTLSCDAKRSLSNWASLQFAYLDANWSILATRQAAVTSQNYQSYYLSHTAPANSKYAIVLFYSEDSTRYDKCQLSSGNVAPRNLLLNAGFESGNDAWFNCADAANLSISSDANSGTKAMNVKNGGCVYQDVYIEAGMTYKLSCSAKRASTGWASMTLAFSGANWQQLASQNIPITSNSYSPVNITLAAPVGSVHGIAVFYSEDSSFYDDCSLEAQGALSSVALDQKNSWVGSSFMRPSAEVLEGLLESIKQP